MKFMFGLQYPLTCNPSTTLSNPCNKVRGKYVVKEAFLRPSFLRPLFVRLFNYCIVVMMQRWLYNTTTITITPLLFIIAWFGVLPGMKGSVCISKSQKPFFRTDSVLFMYHFGRMVKFQFLAQFSVDHLAHPVVSSFILLLRSFATFAYVINRFVFVATKSTLAYLLRISYFRINIIGTYEVHTISFQTFFRMGI